MHSVNVNSDTFLYVGSYVFVLASVEFGVSKLSVAFVDVPSFVHNNSTGTFVSGFYNYILSLFKLAYGMSFCSSKVIVSSFRFARGYVKFNSVLKGVKSSFSVVRGVPSTFVMESSVVFVGCRGIAVFVKKILGKSYAS